MQFIDRHSDAPWLPSGGIAEVVLVFRGEVVPGPVGLVRLLLVDEDGRIFCVPRTGGRPGWDIPTTPVSDAGADAAIDALTRVTFGTRQQVDLVGAVRNVVPPEVEYEWPSPVAYFSVYRPLNAPEPVADGVWLSAEEAAGELSERHWWALVAATERKGVDEFWGLVDARASELLETDEPWAAYEIAMEIAGLEFNEAWRGVIDFDGVFYVAWIELTDLFDAPWWNKRLTLEEADRLLRDAGREWLATPIDARRELLATWQDRLAQLADNVR